MDISLLIAILFISIFYPAAGKPGVGSCNLLNGAKIFTNSQTAANTCISWNGVNQAFNNIFNGLNKAPNGIYYGPDRPNFRQADTLNRANLLAIMLRVAFHDAGEADMANPSDNLGPDGCLSNTSPNNGLIEANSLVTTVLDPIWQVYCDRISRADFWVMAAKWAVEWAEKTDPNFVISYQYGRADKLSCDTPNERLPSGQLGSSQYTEFFKNRLGLSIANGIALLGGHTLGHVHPTVSGYGKVNISSALTNAWDTTPDIFDNLYYRSMINPNWINNVDTTANLNIFKIPNENIMLNSDLAAGFNIDTSTSGKCTSCGVNGQKCGKVPNTPAFSLDASNYGCRIGNQPPILSSNPLCPTFKQVATYASDVSSTTSGLQLFLNDYKVAQSLLLSVGYSISPDATGKLGKLTTIDLSTCTTSPTTKPSKYPSVVPSSKPSSTWKPSVKPSFKSSLKPSVKPSANPSVKSTLNPTSKPSVKSSSKPSVIPSSKSKKVF